MQSITCTGLIALDCLQGMSPWGTGPPQYKKIQQQNDLYIVQIRVYELINRLETILELCGLELFPVLETLPLFCYDQAEKQFDIINLEP